jgi:cytochrome c oxidase cbb3-type subunit 3
MKWALALCVPILLAACEREDRAFRSDVPPETREQIALTGLSPGNSPPMERPSGLGPEYQNNAYHLSQGKKWYSAFNCNGCHSNGGGGSGPALMDDKWIYGGRIENIVQSIREGRPNGMPSWRGKITDQQIWEIAAYVQSMSGNISSDVAPGRDDDLAAKLPETMLVPQPPKPETTPQ